MDVYKLLIVGDAKVGKSTLIANYLTMGNLSDLQMKNLQNLSANYGQRMVSADNTPEAMDFVLKILNVNGKKIRLQLWDIGGNTDPNTAFPNTAFTPLFIRNAIGCVIVAKSDDPKSLSNVIDWKTCFDYQTTASLYQTALPTMILINHFDSAEQSTFSTTPKIPQNKSFDQLELQIQTLLKGCSLHHVDSESGYGLDEAFESFIKVLMEDIEKSKPQNPFSSLIEFLIDKSRLLVHTLLGF